MLVLSHHEGATHCICFTFISHILDVEITIQFNMFFLSKKKNSNTTN